MKSVMSDIFNLTFVARSIIHVKENRYEFSPKELKEEANKYDHRKVCEMVEEELGNK